MNELVVESAQKKPPHEHMKLKVAKAKAAASM